MRKLSVSEAYKAGHRFVVERIVTGYKDGSDFCLNRVEAELIEYYDSVNCGYNRTRGNKRAVLHYLLDKLNIRCYTSN